MSVFVPPPSSYELPEQILGFVQTERDAGRTCALIVVTGLSGGSMRQVGSLSAVSESGVMAGYVSNGCIDADIAAQAGDALAEGRPRALKYGAGSPFIDLQLPCGGSVDLLIVPAPDPAAIDAALAALAARAEVHLRFDPGTGVHLATALVGQTYRYTPALRLIIAGKGPALSAMVRHAVTSDIVTTFASPQVEDQESLAGTGAETAFELTSPWAPVRFDADPWTAVVTLFHDHVWETAILKAAVETDAFYIGCLGSVRTQAARRLALEAEGVTPAQIGRILGPIGLIPSSRSANDLAISVLAEIRMHHKARVAEVAAA